MSDTDTGADAGTDPDTDAEGDADTDTGTGTGAGTDLDTDHAAGIDADAEPGADTDLPAATGPPLAADGGGGGTAVLAFSGGLDTTVCVPLLHEEYGYDRVLAVTVDVGQPEAELAAAAQTAADLGVEHRSLDATREFAEQCLDAVAANATYQGYPLGTALARPVIAEAVVEVADEVGAAALAHGATGKGNDQLRFEAVWRRTDYAVVAPVRELGLTRDREREYAAERGLPVESGTGSTYSVDTNLWSRSVEGEELEDPATVPDEEIYEWTAPPGDRPADPEDLVVEFEAGRPVALDGKRLDPVALVETLNDRAGAHGVGRSDLMEDRMLGLKVRENYEHPAATVLLTAHEALEGLVLTGETRAFKRRVDDRWAEKAYEGLLASQLVAGLESFIGATQERVTGSVTVRLEGGAVRPVARDSPHAVYSAAAASFDTESVLGIEQSDATGVAKYHGFQDRLAALADRDRGRGQDGGDARGDGDGDGGANAGDGGAGGAAGAGAGDGN